MRAASSEARISRILHGIYSAYPARRQGAADLIASRIPPGQVKGPANQPTKQSSSQPTNQPMGTNSSNTPCCKPCSVSCSINNLIEQLTEQGLHVPGF